MTGSIYELARQVLVGEAPNPAPATNTQRGLCLSFIRHIGDRALGVSTYALGNITPINGNITAAQAERGFLAAGYSVNSILPGDWIFQPFFQNGENVGHCAISMGVGEDGVHRVLENCLPVRGIPAACGPAVRLTPFSEWGRASLIVRFPQDHKDPARKPVNVAGITSATTAPTGGLLSRVGEAVAAGDLTMLIRPPEGPDYSSQNPLAVYNTLAAYEGKQPAARVTNLSFPSQDVTSLVVLRKVYSDTSDFAMPVIGPFSIAVQNWQERLSRAWANLASYLKTSEAWGRSYSPIQQLSDTSSGAYRWPIPFVSEFSVRQDAGVGAVANVTLQISDATEAEMVYATLAQVARYRNALIEIWRPVEIFDHVTGSTRSVVVPAFSGFVDELSGAFPHQIKMRLIPQSQAINGRGIDADEMTQTTWPAGTPIWKIVQSIGAFYKILFVTPSAVSLADLPGLQRVISGSGLETMNRPPLDVVRELVERTCSLQLVELVGLEVFGKQVLPFGPRAVYAIYDPGVGPFSPAFWQNELFSKILDPISQVINRGQPVAGEVLVCYAANLGRDTQYITRMAAIFATFATDAARKQVFGKFIDTVLSIASVAGVGNGAPVRAALDGDLESAIVELLDGWFPKTAGPRLATYFCPVLDIEDMTTRQPTAQSLSNPIFGTPAGATNLRSRRVTADRAAKLMAISQSPDGTYRLQTPTGTGVFQDHDSVNLYWQSNQARPTLAVPVNTDGTEIDETPPTFFPYEISLRCSPAHGARIGQQAVLLLGSRLDGIWEVSGIEYSLGRTDEQVLRLRCMRDIFII